MLMFLKLYPPRLCIFAGGNAQVTC